MLHIQCNQCGAWTTSGDGLDPDGQLACGCCPLDHHHGLAANACPGAEGSHPGAACPAPENCIARTPLGRPCPGEHCGLGVEGCTVCRPITITLMAGSVQVR